MSIRTNIKIFFNLILILIFIFFYIPILYKNHIKLILNIFFEYRLLRLYIFLRVTLQGLLSSIFHLLHSSIVVLHLLFRYIYRVKLNLQRVDLIFMLKFLLACLSSLNRVEGLRLIIYSYCQHF